MIDKIKSILIPIILISILNNCIQAQKVDSIFYDKDWNKSIINDFKYYRLYVQVGSLIKVTDYYKNGRIQMTGGFKSINFTEPTGPFFYYDKKKRISELKIFEPKNYPSIVSEINNSGIAVPFISDTLFFRAFYYKNGKIKSLGYGTNLCSWQGTWLYFRKNGDLDSKVNFLNDRPNGEYGYYFNSLCPFIKGYYKDGKREGNWEYYNLSGQLTKTVRYFNGNKIKTIR
jgi:antitoxin component YwqK of YwqJK toxin-antitoxin module